MEQADGRSLPGNRYTRSNAGGEHPVDGDGGPHSLEQVLFYSVRSTYRAVTFDLKGLNQCSYP